MIFLVKKLTDDNAYIEDINGYNHAIPRHWLPQNIKIGDTIVIAIMKDENLSPV